MQFHGPSMMTVGQKDTFEAGGNSSDDVWATTMGRARPHGAGVRVLPGSRVDYHGRSGRCSHGRERDAPELQSLKPEEVLSKLDWTGRNWLP